MGIWPRLTTSHLCEDEECRSLAGVLAQNLERRGLPAPAPEAEAGVEEAE